MKHNYIYALLLAFFISFSSNAQTASLRGIYVDGFSSILGNTVLEDSLLRYAQDSSFNYLALYDLHSANFSSTAAKNQLAAFISKARLNYGITYVGAVGESYSFFQSKIGPYNSGRSDANEKFNVFNLEFEFWTTSSVSPGGYYCTQYLQPNGCNCDSSGGFQFFISNMHNIDSLAATQNALSETYVGWFNQGQGSQIQRNVDRVLLHAYRVDNSSVYGYSKTRLQYLASNSTMVDVAPIFSSEPIFMGPWLNSHSQIEAYNKYKTDFNADAGSYTSFVNLIGYQWFDYGYMPKPTPGSGGGPGFTPTISATGSTTFCSGGSVILTAGGGTSYFWSSGQTSSSITVSTAGTYSCQVTYNGATQTTSTITVNVNPTPTVTVTAGTLGNYSIDLTANATAGGSATISSYQWKKDNVNISGATSSVLTASSTGSYTATVVNNLGCSSTSGAESVVIPGVCNLTTPSGCRSTVLSTSSVKLYWSALPQTDSIIIRYKPETSNNYSYVRLPYTGQTEYTLTNLNKNTKYQWRIKTSCGSTSGSYSSTKTFITGSRIMAQDLATLNYRNTNSGNNLEESEMMIYPNPAKEQFTLTYNSPAEIDVQIQIMDISGRIVREMKSHFSPGENEVRFDTADLNNGLYMLSIRNENLQETKRIIIQK